mmetsp:Transcript_98195/g.233704  ORF Transcript_98195/g.233704 Transcript_98195/m.233704 type:complete len:298 (-) Transcript_98195:41-934(-)
MLMNHHLETLLLPHQLFVVLPERAVPLREFPHGTLRGLQLRNLGELCSVCPISVHSREQCSVPLDQRKCSKHLVARVAWSRVQDHPSQDPVHRRHAPLESSLVGIVGLLVPDAQSLGPGVESSTSEEVNQQFRSSGTACCARWAILFLRLAPSVHCQCHSLAKLSRSGWFGAHGQGQDHAVLVDLSVALATLLDQLLRHAARRPEQQNNPSAELLGLAHRHIIGVGSTHLLHRRQEGHHQVFATRSLCVVTDGIRKHDDSSRHHADGHMADGSAPHRLLQQRAQRALGHSHLEGVLR